MGYYNNYLALPEVRRAIHVGNLTFQNGDQAAEHLRTDFMQSVEEKVVFLADENYKVLSNAPYSWRHISVLFESYIVLLLFKCRRVNACLTWAL